MTDHFRGQANGVERLYLDFDSFFASAEQHFNSELRGRPVGVVPLDSPNTGCIAISREAKALGLKGSASIAEARALIPDMIFVVARHDVYVRLHKRILEVIDSCLPIAHVRSIDELVCELRASEQAEGAALGARIKAALAAQFSDTLTCSIGMAPTELLAKIAAESSKPDGFCLIESADLPDKLQASPLRKLPGISDGIEMRLANAGVTDFMGLWKLAPKQARAIWGNVEGERFWNGLHGYHVERPVTKKRMFGHSRMLPPDWRSPEKVSVCARQLCLSAGRRLRRETFHATKMTLSFRGGGYRTRRRSKKDDLRWEREFRFQPTRDDRTLLDTLREGLGHARREMRFKPRSVSVMLHGLIEPAAIMTDLFERDEAAVGTTSQIAKRAQWEKISDVMDRLRSELGPNAISLGPPAEVPGGYLGAKIAFGRIPDQEDFNTAPVDDGDTHFCTL